MLVPNMLAMLLSCAALFGAGYLSSIDALHFPGIRIMDGYTIDATVWFGLALGFSVCFAYDLSGSGGISRGEWLLSLAFCAAALILPTLCGISVGASIAVSLGYAWENSSFCRDWFQCCRV